MSISLNNHESRIKALENSSSSLPLSQVSSNTYGKCFKYGNLLIQSGWFNNNESTNATITFSKTFSNVIAFTTSSNHKKVVISNSSAVITDTNWGGKNAATISWIAIGY